MSSIEGDIWDWAISINNKSQVVGYSSGPEGDTFGRGVLWDKGSIYDLNALFEDPNDEWRLSWAYSINDKGEIVGFGQRKDASGEYQNVGFLLTPIHCPVE
ncbi:MAG: hypothetical protein IT210_26035 [Armatimonadetes bacterium]|nr:hypothetical protein [Armatimonadota bacterium]